jgi:hypothetical protein
LRALTSLLGALCIGTRQVMIFDATDGTTGDHGHVHCRLAWSPDALANWSWCAVLRSPPPTVTQ